MMKLSSEFLTIMMILIMLIIMFNFMLSNLHPIFMVTLLVLYSIMTCFILSKWAQNFIYSIMLFLIMISGLLIMFLYFSSLISNEQNSFTIKPLMSINFMLNLTYMSFYYLSKYNKYPMYTFMENMQMNYLNTNLFHNIMYIYSYPFNNLTLICMFYLLITLLLIIKMCSIKTLALRKLK